MRLLTLGLAGLVLVVAGGCAAEQDPPLGAAEPATGELAGQTFTSTAVTVNGEPRPLVAGTHVVLGLTDDQLSLQAGCNQLASNVRLDGDRLRVGGVVVTQMGCEPRLMQQDTWLADFLADDPTYSMDGDTFTLRAGQAAIELTMKRAGDTDLTGTMWRLEGIGSGSGLDGSVSSVPAGVRSTIQFNPDGTADVMSGCNTGGAEIEIRHSSITFTPVATTEIFCRGAAGGVEAAVFTVLQGKVAHEIDGPTLTLTGGNTSLEYRAS